MLLANQLSLIINKTVYLLFSGKKPIVNLPFLTLFKQTLFRKYETKFLGMYIDNKLSWKPHVNNSRAFKGCMKA